MFICELNLFTLSVQNYTQNTRMEDLHALKSHCASFYQMQQNIFIYQCFSSFFWSNIHAQIFFKQQIRCFWIQFMFVLQHFSTYTRHSKCYKEGEVSCSSPSVFCSVTLSFKLLIAMYYIQKSHILQLHICPSTLTHFFQHWEQLPKITFFLFFGDSDSKKIINLKKNIKCSKSS